MEVVSVTIAVISATPPITTVYGSVTLDIDLVYCGVDQIELRLLELQLVLHREQLAAGRWLADWRDGDRRQRFELRGDLGGSQCCWEQRGCRHEALEAP